MASGIEWSGDLTDKLNQFGPRVKRAMVAAADYVAPQAQQYMRDHAPWTDRSTNARNGLTAEKVVETNRVSILLYHTVPYGPYLELRWSGKYQIINPTVEMFAPVFIETVAELAFK